MALRGKHTVIRLDNSAGTPTAVSTDVQEGSGIPMTYDELEDSGYTQDHSTMKGQGDSTVSLVFYFNDTIHALITDESTGAVKSDTARTITFEYGENAAPTTGDISISGEYVCVSAEPSTAKDGVRTMSTNWRLSGGSMPTYGTVA